MPFIYNLHFKLYLIASFCICPSPLSADGPDQIAINYVGHIKQLNALLVLYFLTFNLQSMGFSTASTDRDRLPARSSCSLISSSPAHWIRIRKQVKIAEASVIFVHLSLRIGLTASTHTLNIYEPLILCIVKTQHNQSRKSVDKSPAQQSALKNDFTGMTGRHFGTA